MHSLAAFIFIYLVVATKGHDINYCGAKMCGYTNAHTFCQFSTGPSPSCTGMIPASLLPEEKSRILARLNRRRNEAAGGKLRGLPCAGNMLKLRWVEELAREAQLWADQCRPQRTPEEHDACRDLYSISVGQCVASVVGESPGLKVESMVDIWFMQNKFFKGNVTVYEPPKTNKHFYGDFAQMLWARSFMVGCGRSRFMLPVNGRLRTIERLVCNFAPQGPIFYRPLWNIGIPATACPSRSRPCSVLTSLCDYQKELNQPKDIDASMTIEDHILLNALLEIERNETLFEGNLDEIYLTYLAIVTMQSTDATTSRYNSMQKRDVVEKLYVDDSIDCVKSNEFRQHSKLQTIQTTTTKILSKKLFPKKKLKTIGRPKAYKLEELSNTSGDHKDENQDTTEAVLKRKKYIYYDYTMDKLDDNNTSIVTEQVTERKVLEKVFNENYTFEDHTYEMIPVSMKTTAMVALLDEPKFNTDGKDKTEKFQAHLSTTTMANESIANIDNTVDEYLSDPETVRQLQEVLDRIENEASNTSSSTKKTRRDVQDAEMSDEISNDVTPLLDDFPSPFTLDATDIASTLSPERGGNNSDTPPVLTMMLKYMPYLKHYENEMLGPLNSASCICPSVILIMLVMHA